jgi:XRE family transcriptional regulator, regulator of sulfur utilization
MEFMDRRDFFAVLAVTAFAPEAFAAADTAPVMGSRVFDWDSIPVKQTSYGSVRSFCSEPTATLENLELHVTTLNPGQQPHPPHHHPNEEMIILRQGTVETLSNGEWKRLGAGSVIFNGSNQLHGLRNIGTEPAIYHVINWKTAATPKA